jgi:acyl-CoA dehydrogenase
MVTSGLARAIAQAAARTLRIADGPDEVHRILIAKNVLKRYHAGESWDFGN